MSRPRRSSFTGNPPYGYIDPAMLAMPFGTSRTPSNSSGSSSASYYDFSASPNNSSSAYTSPDLSYTAGLGPISSSKYSSGQSYSQPFFTSSASKQPASSNAFNKSFSPTPSASTSRSASARPSASMSPTTSLGQGGSAGPSRKRKDRTIPETNPNEYLLNQSNYPLSSLPPASYSGPSPFAVPETPPYLYASEMDTASELERRLGSIERGIGGILESRGQRALLDSTLSEPQRTITTTSTSPSFASFTPTVSSEPWAPTFISRPSSTRPSSSKNTSNPNSWPRFT